MRILPKQPTHLAVQGHAMQIQGPGSSKLQPGKLLRLKKKKPAKRLEVQKCCVFNFNSWKVKQSFSDCTRLVLTFQNRSCSQEFEEFSTGIFNHRSNQYWICLMDSTSSDFFPGKVRFCFPSKEFSHSFLGTLHKSNPPKKHLNKNARKTSVKLSAGT